MTENQRLPGRSRARDVVINGELVDRVLMIDAEQSKACSQVWATGEYTQLHLGGYENPNLRNIECLDNFENIKKIHIMLDYKVDMSPLDRHAKILNEYFCNDNNNPIINCEKYINLRVLSQPWSSKIVFADIHPQLQGIFFDKYCHSKKNLSALPMAPNLRKLSLLRPCITNLNEIDKYSCLEKLIITWAKYLVMIGNLVHCSSLKIIEIEGCKQIGDLQETLGKCYKLERLVLMKVSSLNSIGFVTHMPNLKWLNLMDTNVIDGDMSPLLSHPSLEYVVFTSKKHFSHTEAQVRSVLQAKKGG